MSLNCYETIKDVQIEIKKRLVELYAYYSSILTVFFAVERCAIFITLCGAAIVATLIYFGFLDFTITVIVSLLFIFGEFMLFAFMLKSITNNYAQSKMYIALYILSDYKGADDLEEWEFKKILDDDIMPIIMDDNFMPTVISSELSNKQK